MAIRKIEPGDEVQVYLNPKCNVCIKQISNMGKEEIIIVHREDVPLLIEHLHSIYEEAMQCEPERNEETD